ncbi:diacylglycerol kinase family protein [Patescibacteria group bacterium]|nr:MAG: diacylglycerol kinase family protein [Patescibacteria group bacterium]
MAIKPSDQESEIKRFNRSFRHALSGLKYAVSYERNFQIELVVAFFVVVLIKIFEIKSWEAVVLVLMIMWVLITELTNTVVERVVDILKPRIHPYAKLIKDIMAAVVLISSVMAAVVGIIIFYPYFRRLLEEGVRTLF